MNNRSTPGEHFVSTFTGLQPKLALVFVMIVETSKKSGYL
jgi:hypothetical protein